MCSHPRLPLLAKAKPRHGVGGDEPGRLPYPFPAFSVQYLAWVVAAAYLLDILSATLYNILGGLFLYQIYDYWNGGLPWFQGPTALRFTSHQIDLAALLWAVLIVVLVRGARQTVSVGDLDIAEPGRLEPGVGRASPRRHWTRTRTHPVARRRRPRRSTRRQRMTHRRLSATSCD